MIGRPGEAGPAGRLRHGRMLAFIVGCLLVAAAVWIATGQSGSLATAWKAIRIADPMLIGLALALPVVSLVLTSAVFWILTTRYGVVGRREMLELISSAWLLNYLPLWPGMIGRLAYHQRVNRIPIPSSAVALIWANVLTLAAALVQLAAIVAAALFSTPGGALFTVACASPVMLCGALAVYAKLKPPAPDPPFWRLPASLTVRLVEMQVWGARYYVAFALIGAPLGWGAALVLACATQLATLLPITGNGLGLREWVVGIAAPLLPLGFTLRADVDMGTALSADLVHRAIEVALAAPIGIIATSFVARRLSRARTA